MFAKIPLGGGGTKPLSAHRLNIHHPFFVFQGSFKLWLMITNSGECARLFRILCINVQYDCIWNTCFSNPFSILAYCWLYFYCYFLSMTYTLLTKECPNTQIETFWFRRGVFRTSPNCSWSYFCKVVKFLHVQWKVTTSQEQLKMCVSKRNQSLVFCE